MNKPRTYRQNARKDYLRLAKSRRLSASKRRQGIRKQLGYLRRNLSHIESLKQFVPLSVLKSKQYHELLVIHVLYRQQQEMYDNRSHRIDDRIVSISQPYIRPIVRGKVKSPTEFGAKISASVVCGFPILIV
jgi:transposase, IS5 family